MDRHDTLEGEAMANDLSGHRPDVCRRLLEQGLSVDLLRTILPDWDPWITQALNDA